MSDAKQSGPCRIENGVVYGCEAMTEYCQPAGSHSKGMEWLQLTNFTTMERRIAGVVYKDRPSSSGILLNVCPWCGQEINATEEARHA